jgi:hypothetical protein
MPIARIGGQGLFAGSATQATLAQPGTALAVGDFRVLTLFRSLASGTITPPAGGTWTQILAPTAIQSGVLGVWYRFHQAADASFLWDWTSTGGQNVVGRCTNLSGVDPAVPVDSAAVTGNSAATTAWANVPSVVTANPDAWAFWWIVRGTGNTAVAPTLGAGGWTAEGVMNSQASGYAGLGAYEARPTPGATGVRTVNSTTSQAWRAVAFSINPVPSPSGTGRRLIMA